MKPKLNAKQLARKQRRWKTIGEVILYLPVLILLSPFLLLLVAVQLIRLSWFVANLLVMACIAVVRPSHWLQEQLGTVEAGDGPEPLPAGVAMPKCLLEYARPRDEVRYRGMINPDWIAFAKAMRPGDQIWSFSSSDYSWRMMMGRSGYALVRQGRVIERLVTTMN